MFAMLSSRSLAADTQRDAEAGLRAERSKFHPMWGFLSNDDSVTHGTRLQAVPAPSPLTTHRSTVLCWQPTASLTPHPASSTDLFWDLGQAGKLPNTEMPADQGGQREDKERDIWLCGARD